MARSSDCRHSEREVELVGRPRAAYPSCGTAAGKTSRPAQALIACKLMRSLKDEEHEAGALQDMAQP